MASCSESIIQEEIEVLQSIYLPDELTIRSSDDRPTEIIVMLHPYTAENEDGKYVCMQLVIKLDKKYPNMKPSFELKMPRGISDAQLESIKVNLDGLAYHRLGEAMLFELIEYAKECLTSNNKPECTCAICLDYFDEEDNFTRTECYHFFHDVCLARYVKSYLESCENKVIGSSPFEEQPVANKDVIPCPICRTGIKRDLLEKNDVEISSYKSEKIMFEPSTKFLAWRKRVNAIYLRQQKRGGIIDIEAQRNKYLIETKTTDDEVTPEAFSDPRLVEDEGIHILGDIGSWISESRIVEQSLLATNANSNRTTMREPIKATKSNTDYASRPTNNNVPRTESGGRAPSQIPSKTKIAETDANSNRTSTREPVKSTMPSTNPVSRPINNNVPRTEPGWREPSQMGSNTRMAETTANSNRTATRAPIKANKPNEDAAFRPKHNNERRTESSRRAPSQMTSRTRMNETNANSSRTSDSASRPTNNNLPRTEPGWRAPSQMTSKTRMTENRRERERTGCRQPRRTKENGSPSAREHVEHADPSRVSNRRAKQFTETSTQKQDRDTVDDKRRSVSTENQERTKAQTKLPVRPPPGFKPLS